MLSPSAVAASPTGEGRSRRSRHREGGGPAGRGGRGGGGGREPFGARKAAIGTSHLDSAKGFRNARPEAKAIPPGEQVAARTETRVHGHGHVCTATDTRAQPGAHTGSGASGRGAEQPATCEPGGHSFTPVGRRPRLRARSPAGAGRRRPINNSLSSQRLPSTFLTRPPTPLASGILSLISVSVSLLSSCYVCSFAW